MKNRGPVILAVISVIAVVPMMLSLAALSQAHDRLDSAQASLLQSKRDAQEILELRSKQQVINIAQRPTQDVIAQVNTALAAVGIPSGRLKSLVPESDSPIARATPSGPQYKRQSLRLTLEGLNVRDLGAFLLRWRDSQNVWTPARIEMTHSRMIRDQSHDRELYDAMILLSAIYLDQR